MKKVLIEQVFIVVVCIVLPHLLVYSLHETEMFLLSSDRTKEIVVYATLGLTAVSSAFLFRKNILLFRRSDQIGWLANLLFMSLSLFGLLYSIVTLYFVIGLRHGVSF